MRQYFTVAAVTRLSNTCDQASHSGGFASMDADKQREIASQGKSIIWQLRAWLRGPRRPGARVNKPLGNTHDLMTLQ